MVLARAKNVGRFLYRKYFKGYSVPDFPHFDDASTSFFNRALSDARFYLEYGSGGSTVSAARLGKPFIAVDSDRLFLAAVKTKVSHVAPYSEGHYIHANIGLTKEWGQPVFRLPTPARLKTWRAYSECPWDYISSRMLPAPDLILIDGRFRVACALTSIERLGKNADWTILIDDYHERPNYRAIEEFAELFLMAGRMAVFRKRQTINYGRLRAAISDATRKPE